MKESPSATNMKWSNEFRNLTTEYVLYFNNIVGVHAHSQLHINISPTNGILVLNIPLTTSQISNWIEKNHTPTHEYLWFPFGVSRNVSSLLIYIIALWPTWLMKNGNIIIIILQDPAEHLLFTILLRTHCPYFFSSIWVLINLLKSIIKPTPNNWILRFLL